MPVAGCRKDVGNRYLELATWECGMHVHLTSFPWQRAEGGKEGGGVGGQWGGGGVARAGTNPGSDGRALSDQDGLDARALQGAGRRGGSDQGRVEDRHC